MDIHDRSYSCETCNKNYASYKSLWNHNKKYHTSNLEGHNTFDNTYNTSHNTFDNTLHNTSLNYNCKFCNKEFKNYQNRWKHETKVCKLKTSDTLFIKLEKTIQKNEVLENKIKELENKVNNKTINTTNNNNITNNQNNGTINNITINQFGKENINALTIKDIKQLIKNDNYLVDIVKLLNFNEKFPENHNFCNTSLEGKYISVFNSNTNAIEKINKNDFYEKVLCNSFDKMDNLSLILELNKDVKEQIKEKYKEHLDNKLTHIRDIFYKDKIYKKNYKTNINELSYNKNKVVLDTWATVPEITNEDELSDSETSKYSALTSDSSDDES